MPHILRSRRSSIVAKPSESGGIPKVKRYPIVAFVALVVALFSVTVASGQAPPGPATRYLTRFTAVTPPAPQFDIVQLVSEFAPGAAVAFHSHGGPEFITVIEGELTFRESGKAGVLVKAGETITQVPSQVMDVSNTGSGRARTAVAFLLPAGAALTTLQPGVIPPSLGPRVLGLTRSQVTAPAASFDVVQLVLDFAPGVFTAVHRHGAPGQVTVFEGTLVRRLGTTDTAFPAGQGWLEPLGAHSAGNLGSTPGSLAAAFLLPAGVPLTTVVTAPAPPATGTGTAGQAGAAWQLPVALLAVTLLAGATAFAARRSRR